MNSVMKPRLLLVSCAAVATAALGAVVVSNPFPLVATSIGAAVHPGVQGHSSRLHNGWVVNPVGEQTLMEDMPSNLCVSPDGKYLVVATSGWRQHRVRVFEIGPSPAGRPGSDLRYDREAKWIASLPALWRGMRFGVGEQAKILYVAGGPKGCVYRLELDPKTFGLRVLDAFPLPTDANPKPFAGGLDVLPDGRILVLDEAADKGPGKADVLYALDPGSGKVLGSSALTADAGAVAATPDGSKIYVAEHGAGQLLVLKGSDLSRQGQIAVGVQPNALLVDHRGRLYCANTGSDTVSVVDTARDAVTETIHTAMTPRSPLGSVPNALALSPDEKTLYVSNAGNNDVAVVDVSGSGSSVEGFVPTGHYPVSVAVAPKNDWLFIGSGKGLQDKPNDTLSGSGEGIRVNQPAGQAYGPHHDRILVHDYIMSTLDGSLARLPVPQKSDLSRYTRLVLQGSPYRDALLARAAGKPANSVLPDRPGAPSPFEHVLYIIKENRTYDQVLGDMTKGDGDPNLVLFGRGVTPNHHRIADQFVLLDNVYCDGEVSQDGWEWSTAANDSDWDIKATAYGYGGHGDVPGSRETIRPSNGYLWEHAGAKGLTYYSYGAKTFAGLFSPTWKGHFSHPWNDARRDGVPDYQKADLFVKDLKEAEKTGKWPNLVVMSLADDHTVGTRPGGATPYAAVASNDLALGKVIEAMTRSRFWSKTAIFVIEDDSQNGPDHVDAHRTVALVASPYTRRGSVDHTMYTTSSLVRSIELCLGLPPTSQYDAGATPMFDCFTGPSNLQSYACVVPQVDLNAKNTRQSPMAAVSATLDFHDVDLADFDTLNHILWKACKPGEAYPGSHARYVLR